MTGSGDPKRRAVALLSGGLDSGVALADWVAGGGTVQSCICADYGQRSYERESAASRALARRFGVPWQRVDLPWLGDAARAAGVEMLCHGTRITRREVTLAAALPVDPAPQG